MNLLRPKFRNIMSGLRTSGYLKSAEVKTPKFQ
jgi:hypothetical protein